MNPRKQILEALSLYPKSPYDVGRQTLLDMKVVFDTLETLLASGEVKQTAPGMFHSVKN